MITETEATITHVPTETMPLSATAPGTIASDIVKSDAITPDAINSGSIIGDAITFRITTGDTTVTIIAIGKAIDNSSNRNLWALSRLLPHGKEGL